MNVNEENIFEKCNPEHICTWLENRVESVGHSGKGFVPVYVVRPVNGPLGHTSMIRVLYGVNYKQDRGDSGILINYCPFCGGTPGRFAQEMKR